jgi:hypothetical protein
MGPIGPMGLIGRCLLLTATSSFARYADLFRHVDKLNDRFSLHFAHDVSAMDFYGDLARNLGTI